MRHPALTLAGLVAPALLLGACATTQPSLATDMLDGPASSYGLFLAGQGALNDGRSSQAASYFNMAAEAEGDTGLIAERAFTAAVLSGDITRAAQMAPSGPDASDNGKRLGRLVVAVEAMAQGKPKIAQPLLRSEDLGFVHRSAGVLLAPWAAAMAGDTDGSLVRPQVRGDRVVDYFGLLGQAYLYERARRYDEAETDFKELTKGDAPGDMVILAYGGFLERRGRRVDAQAIYNKGLAEEPQNSVLKAARDRAASGKAPPPAPNLKQGAAAALIAPAAGMMSAKQTQFALTYLRLALRLDPQRNEAWLMVGDMMEAAGDTEAARAAYGVPKPGSPEFGAAQAKLAWSYQNAGDGETALKLARAAAAAPGAGQEAQVTLADLLRANEKFAESAEVLTGVIAGDPDWRLLYARGVAYDRAGRWADGERDLQAALKQQPDDSELLNYLGYSWIDRGQHLAEALAMVQKAVGQNPRSGAMIDSLGWAYYRLGDYKKSVETLEEAVEQEAGDPDINNHLGDAYWQVGRRDEAMFQWRRVLTLAPDAKLKAEVETKIASGVGPAAPAKIAAQ
ncbi:tetratricopeptide repeat protein [Phenylobacterium aquaticum]|uniref:tetratricopeptide repeat protein n=1 Tax=Phenylobacterium aquaticum TaxID=1763816 RepID=UPI001F5DD9AF|nr:tetratricopeptide repeat protein [Phenylobacterium aquaticum]MCI3135537.1 tetratricopeptide repeat protein [Phenylobacterium aquaticum]